MICSKESASHEGEAGLLRLAKVTDELDQFGTATLGQLFSKEQCNEIVGLYDASDAFRSTITMARHGFGRGEYKYFANPLPEIISASRKALYARLSPIATRWSERLGSGVEYPISHDEYLAICHAVGQTRPTPLILQYVEGDYNCLHQDLYGDLAFPLQVAVLLSQPGEDFTGGEFVLTEQRPRMQSRAEVVSLQQGDAVVLRSMIDRCVARVAIIASRCAMESAACAQVSVIRWALYFTMHDKGLQRFG